MAWGIISAGCTSGPDIAAPGAPDSSSSPLLTITWPEWSGGIPRYLEVTRFSWTSAGEEEPVEVRHMVTMHVDTTGAYNTGFDLLSDINENPERYDTLWSDWIPYGDEGGPGRTVVAGEEGELTLFRRHWFFVQGRAGDGTVTKVFERETNARYFLVTSSRGPLLYVSEPLLANFRFMGLYYNPEVRQFPPGVDLSFYWRADVSQYSSEIAGYRYGWDVASFEDWDAPFETGTTYSEPAAFFAGVHTLTVEASDLAGNISRGRITVEIVPWEMSRDLLLVDDFYGAPAPVPDLSIPSNDEHSAFWESICSQAAGFDPSRDVYDTYSYSHPPSVELIGQYRNMVWTSSPDASNVWSRMVEFTPESDISASKDETPNLISIFLARGGHVWTSGRSDRNGGLAAVLQEEAQTFPLDVRCEIAGPDRDCGDRSGVNSLPYRDLCVTVIDKLSGRLRTDDDMPYRSLEQFDVMRSAFRDDGDPVTSTLHGMPESLLLREEVSAPGSFFCTDSTCSPGGFTYVEVYDPSYWMSRRGAVSRNCFHPLYRMRAASDASVLDGQPVAVWSTAHEHIVPDAPGGTAAPSVHFGMPLWFFRHESVDSIAAVIFDRWGI